ncbi:precorrin-3B synthase (plasmid) [Rhizobium etli 8C-3]|uniref:Precorrin-3B synthase n=2 Tax=Rhizobium etli TaxID=29449 RepID=A0A1L5PF64_RHIET|nr:precorrin-3B synthase [Rhizobium etli 8C-3]
MKGRAMGFAGEREIDMEGRAIAAPGSRRGACPTLAAPMATGDGLLARLRPAGGALTPSQLNMLAVSAAANGNGVLEITGRGSLQVRGLRPETVGRLAADVDAAGILVPAGPPIELSPLHGIDPGEIGNAAAIEARLRNEHKIALSSPLLAPKLSIIVDGGGRFGLSGLSADIRVDALDEGRWLVAIDGDAKAAKPVCIGSADDAARAVGRLLAMLMEIGKNSRARDIGPTALREVFPAMELQFAAGPNSQMPRPGLHQLCDDSAVLGLRPRFGQMKASALSRFLGQTEPLGAAEIRLAPGRQFFVTGCSTEAAKALQAAAKDYGFSSDADDPSANIAACAGAGACASGFYETRMRAQHLLRHSPVLFDGSLTFHLSGCSKGCAHPRPALALTGMASGYGIVLSGLAGDSPDATIAGGKIDFAIEKLARLVENNKSADESAAACLTRLGPQTIVKALKQE